MLNGSKAAMMDLVARGEGYENAFQMLEDLICDSMAPAVCTECGEVYECPLEQDAQDVKCEHCSQNKVDSVFILAGVI